MSHIDYYFFGASPFSYLGHRAFEAVARRHGRGIAYRPVHLPTIWAESGAVPPAQRPPVRQRYRLIELQRAAERRGLPINLKPAHFPVDASLADGTVIALLDRKLNPSDYIEKVLSGVWARDENIADRQVLFGYLDDCGFDADALLAAAEGADCQQRLKSNAEAAKAAGAVGVPTYVLNGEPFWGQDRIDDLDRALESGRAPFVASTTA